MVDEAFTGAPSGSAFYKRLEFERSAVSSDKRIVFQHSGTLWRDPITDQYHWLHPSTVQREGLVDRARAGIDEEQQRLDGQREEGGVEDPMFSEIEARTPKAPGMPSQHLEQHAYAKALGHGSATDWWEEAGGPDTEVHIPLKPTGGEHEGWRYSFVGDQVAIDNQPTVLRYREQLAGLQASDSLGLAPIGKNIVVPLALIKAIADAG